MEKTTRFERSINEDVKSPVVGETMGRTISLGIICYHSDDVIWQFKKGVSTLEGEIGEDIQ